MGSVGSTTASPRLGGDFVKLWSANVASNLGDGIALAAGPLLVASLTSDPVLVSGAAVVQMLPWLLVSLLSGALVDRLDRRKVIVAVNVARAVVIGGLALAIWTGHGSIPIVYAAFFLLGIGETLADNASSAMVPAVVPRELLPKANARLQSVHFVVNEFMAPPIGAAVFVAAAALPFGINAATFLVAAVLIASMRHRQVRPVEPRRSLKSEIAEGLRWLWAHDLLRVMAVSLCLMNIAFYAPFSIFVLYAREHLHVPEIGFGVLLTASAVGGLAGTFIAAPLQARFGDSALLRVGLVIETATHFGLAMVSDAWLAAAIMVVFGVHAAIWGVVSVSLRQRLVPDRLRGRVGSVYRLLTTGGAAIGSLLGGVLARTWGITAPMWAAGMAMIVLSAFAWRYFHQGVFDLAESGNDPAPAAVARSQEG